MRFEKGVPTVVNVLGNLTFGPSDAIYLPPKYNNEVLLVAQSAAGTAVLKSDDGWMTAEYKGMVPMPQVSISPLDRKVLEADTRGNRWTPEPLS